MNKKLPEQVIIPNNRRFQNLIDLKLFVSASDYCKDLMGFLQNCPKLQSLTIAGVIFCFVLFMFFFSSSFGCCFTNLILLYVLQLLDQDLLKNWKYPITVPNCISSHLQSCTLRFNAFEVDTRLAKYILKYAPLLEVLKITMFEVLQLGGALEELISCPRISSKCNINISIGFDY